MGLTKAQNIISGGHSAATQQEVTIGDGINSNGSYNITDFANFNTAFNTALAALNSSGRIVLLSGTYTLTDDIQIENSGVTVVGDGDVTVDTGRYKFKVYDTAVSAYSIPQVNSVDPQFHTDFFSGGNTASVVENLGTGANDGLYNNTFSDANRGNDGARWDNWGFFGEGSKSLYCSAFHTDANNVAHVNTSSVPATPYLPTDSSGAANAFTVSACVYSIPSSDAVETRTFIGQRDSSSINGGISMYKSDITGKFVVFMVDGAGSSTGTMTTSTVEGFPENEWQHVVASYDGSNTQAGIKIWVNGKPQDLVYASGDPLLGLTNTAMQNPDNTLIGAGIEPLNDGNWWRGYIDYVSIWKGAGAVATDAEVATIYESITNNIDNVRIKDIKFISQNGSAIQYGSDSAKVEDSFVSGSTFDKDTTANPYATGIAGTSLDTNLIGLFLLDEGTGSTTDNLKSATNGTVTGTPIWLASGAKPSYDGASAVRTISPSNSINTGLSTLIPNSSLLPFTLSAWVKALDDSSGATEVIIGHDGPIGFGNSYVAFYRSTNRQLAFTMHDGARYVAMVSNYIVDIGKDWVNVTMTCDGSDRPEGIKLYANGIPAQLVYDSGASPTEIGGSLFTTGNVYIGSTGATPGNFFRGLISTAAFWDRELSPKEAREFYDLGASKDINKYNTKDILADGNISNMDDSEL